MGRQAIQSDPHWREGDYYGKSIPRRGLAIARMIGHITYLSEKSMHQKFGRKLQDKTEYGYDFRTDFQVESYLRYKGDHFVNRFDANSYLYISKAMDYFDLAQPYGSLEQAFANVKAKFLVISFSSDWLFPSYQSKEIVSACRRVGARGHLHGNPDGLRARRFSAGVGTTDLSDYQFPDPREGGFLAHGQFGRRTSAR